MARDGWEKAAECLHPSEAGMLRELLESAGIAAIVEDAGAASLFRVPSLLGGAQVLVPAAEAARAREIVASSGVFEGPAGGGEGEEIPEAEWSAVPPAAEPAPPPDRDALRSRRVAALGIVLGALFLAAVAWLAISAPRRPDLPDPPWRAPPAQRRPFP